MDTSPVVLPEKNRGTGAGGSNTNKNGLSYERLTDLSDKITVHRKDWYSDVVSFVGSDRLFVRTSQSKLFKCMKDEMDTTVEKAHGCKNPDECYIDKEKRIIFIIEKKFQQCSGSVCEKIQTSEFKKWQYERTFPAYKVVYVYCLSDWFKENCKAEIEYFHHRKVPHFWGSSPSYKEEMVGFILSVGCGV